MSALAGLTTRLRPLAEAFAPPIADFTPAQYTASLARMELRLAMETPALRRQLRLLIAVLYLLPVVWTGRTMARLPLPKRVAILAWLQDCPLQLVRVGVWGLRTVVFVGYYADPAVQTALGYRPHPGGWSARTDPSSGPVVASGGPA
jgi:hypothetical protein